MVDLLISILGGIIATIILGGVAYKIIIKKKNKGIIQKNGSNQIAVQKSKNNSINIGGDSSENKK